MRSTRSRVIRTVLAGLTAGVAVGPLVAFGLRSLFLFEGLTFRWVLIGCTLAAALAMAVGVWSGEARESGDRGNV